MHLITLTSWILLCVFPRGAQSLDECESIQFLEVGQTGVLTCLFSERLYSVFWYNSTDTVNDEPILNYKERIRSGYGYESGEYDVTDEGSLIINEVGFIHETMFTVLKFDTRSAAPISNTINVVVTVTPFSTLPMIDKCNDRNRLCFSEEDQVSKITCSVERAKPTIELEWVLRTEERDIDIRTQHTYAVQEGIANKSFSSVRSDSYHSSLLSLLVCKSLYSSNVHLHNESSILIQYGDYNSFNYETTKVWRRLESNVILTCSKKTIKYLVWKKHDENYVTNIAVGVFIAANEIVTSSGFQLNESGSISIHDVQIKHEGFYVCIFNDGITDGVARIELSLFVDPLPLNPVVEGCHGNEYCVLEANNYGTLKCSVYGVRPEVDLQWRTFHESDKGMISFYDENRKVTTNGETFFVILTSKYQLINRKKERLTLMCESSCRETNIFNKSTKFDLLFHEDDHQTLPTTKYPPSDEISPIVLIVVTSGVVTIIVIATVIVVTIICCKGKKRNQRKHISDLEMEQTSMILVDQQNVVQIDKTELLRKELRVSYQNICSSVIPIPFTGEGQYDVDLIYVEGGIEFHAANEEKISTKKWKTLDSYHDILRHPRLGSFLIIEGDPGMGKSTLALKLASDWSTNNPSSPLQNVDILLFLRLRYLGNFESIYETIKECILPKDTLLTPDDIEAIIRNSKSVLLLLDGYDEVPKPVLEKESDFYHICRRNMFNDFRIIVTTRPQCFPKDIAPRSVVLRLTGFNGTSRDKYIDNVLSGGDGEISSRIKSLVQQSQVLGEFFKIPLFFVMSTHLTQREDFNVNFTTVTTFFKFIVKCFHSHHLRKAKRENIMDHKDLDKEAFELLTERDKLFWVKEELLAKVGDDIYSHFVQVGLLCEEQFLSFDSGGISEQRKVTFFHQLFCEWHAAHYLTWYAKKASSAELRKMLKALNPSNYQYVYRFACGLNSESGDKIIQYLKSIEDGETFAYLCILEQTGNAEYIDNTLEEFCSENVLISLESSPLLQRSILQLMDIASRKRIPIDCFHLENTIEDVDAGTTSIQLNSGLKVDQLTNIEELKITERGRELSSEMTSRILHFSIACDGLRNLTFDCCLVPYSFENKYILEKMKEKGITVGWIPTATWYDLIETGHWKERYGEKIMSKEDYSKEVDKFREEWSYTRWQNQ